MFRRIFIQAVNLIRQNPLFSMFYVAGTGFAIAMVMVVAIICYIRVADIYPETNRSRMLIADGGHMQDTENKGNNTTSSFSYPFVRDCFYPLKGVEAVSAFGISAPVRYVHLPGSLKLLPAATRTTDAAFWKVFNFRFMDGKPFTQADFAGGVCTAVISEALARRLFGTKTAAGRTIHLDNRDYRVCGVVKTPSQATYTSYAEVWIPFTTSPDYDKSYLGALGGRLQVAILLHKISDEPMVQEQVDDYVRRFNLMPHEGYKLLMHGKPYEYWETLFATSKGGMEDLDYAGVIKQLGLLILLLLVVPAFNLSGLISGRMNTRMEEVGIRKAFGATSGVLFGELLWENLLLTLLGGVFGLLLSLGIVFGAKNWLFAFADARLANMDNLSIGITPEMLFNLPLFLVTLAVCIVLNLISAFVPTLIALRSPIIYSLNKKG